VKVPGLDMTCNVVNSSVGEHFCLLFDLIYAGGLWHSTLIDRNLITAFVPFLPMERKHVKMCIEDDLRYKNHEVTEDILNKVADALPYYPPDAKLFAASGCKRVSQKVDLLLDKDDDYDYDEL